MVLKKLNKVFKEQFAEDRNYVLALFKEGLIDKMCRDSIIFKSNWLEVESIILNWLMEMGELQPKVWSLIAEWGGLDNNELVRKLLPACSAILL